MKKLVGIFIMMLLIATAIPTIGLINEPKNVDIDFFKNEFVQGEFIVKFKDSPISCVSIADLNEKYNVKSMEKLFKNNEGTILDNIYSFYVSEDADVLSIVEEYASLPTVVYAEPNYIGNLFGIPNDEYFPIQWSLDNTGQVIFEDIFGTPDYDIDAVEAWDIETGNPDIIIAIIDSGIDYNHPDLADNMWINDDEIPNNDIDDDGNGYIDDFHGYDFFENDSDHLDVLGHGTLCAGVAAAVGNNEIGITGVAWNCKIMDIKAADDIGAVNVKKATEGIVYAVDHGAKVLSMSWGFTGLPGFFTDAMDYAYYQGCVLVAACGNFGSSTVFYPAGSENVIGVSATNQNDERCDKEDWDPNNISDIEGSNYGYFLDVAAPGNLLYSTMPTYHVAANDMINPYTVENWSQNYEFCRGTSFACPHVAGLAALLLSQDSSLTNDELIKIIRANVDPYISDEYMGTGRINAYKALTRYNSQPEIPETPTGEASGRTGREYTFTTSSTDPDDEPLYYVWDWGDGNYSDEIGPFNSGETCEATYSWSNYGNYTIIVKAVDGKGGESYWSEPLVVSMPKTKIINEFNPLLFRLIQRFPILELLL